MQNGGAERVIVTQANKLAEENKYEVIIICFRKWIQYELNNCIKIIYLTNKQKFSLIDKIIQLPILTIKMDKKINEIKKENIRLLTTHLPLPHFICRFSKYKNDFLFVMHNPHFQFKFSNTKIFKYLLQKLYNNRKMIAVSKGIKKEITKIYEVKSKKIYTIYNPLNLEYIDNLLKEDSNVDEEEKYFLFCGRMTNQKRPDRMIEVFYKGEFYKKYKLIMLGIGELENEVKLMIKKYNLEDRVIMRGWEQNVYKWMKNAKLLVCTSDYESFGMVLAEALYCECPVVSNNCNYGPDEILRGSLSKYLSSSEESMIDAIKEALKEYPGALKDYVKKFNIEYNLNEYLKIYKEWEEK